MKKTNHLWKRIFFLYAVLILIAFSLVFATVYFTMSNAMQKDRRITMEQQLEICSSKLDARVEEVMSIHTNMLNDDTFRRCIRSYYNGDMTSYQEDALSALLNSTKNSSWLVNTLYILDDEYNIIDSSRVILSEDQNVGTISDLAADLDRTQAFRSFYSADGKLLFLGAIYLDASYDYVTYIGIELNASRMFFNFTSTALKSFQSVYVADGTNVFCRAGNNPFVDVQELDHTLSAELDGSTYAVFTCRNSSYANWKVYALMDESAFYQAVKQQTGMMTLVLIMTIFATLIISMLFAKRITQPLEELTSSFHRLEQGEYPPPLEVDSNDEVSELIQSYNHVVQSLKKLNDNIIAEQEEKRQFEIAAIKTRLDLLQSQIHPHFIHNTLNTLNYMAIEAGNTSLSELITSFNALLRMSISTESDFCTVESEVECIKHYMRILRCRYADRPLQCNYSIDESAKSALLPRLLLQPLVENALYHGILPIEDRLGVIQVQCTTAGDMLCVSVSDNGVGIPEDILQRIKNDQTVSASGYNHIGIKNIKERLQLMYHQECDLNIVTELGSGTTIFFNVPYRR